MTATIRGSSGSPATTTSHVTTLLGTKIEETWAAPEPCCGRGNRGRAVGWRSAPTATVTLTPPGKRTVPLNRQSTR